MQPARPAVLVIAGATREVAEHELTGRYGHDYEVVVTTGLAEAVATTQQLQARGVPLAMCAVEAVLPDAPGLVAMDCVAALVPTAKRLVLVAPEDWATTREAVQEAVAAGRADVALVVPRGARDEEFHTAVCELLSEWGWTTGGPVVAGTVVVAEAQDPALHPLRDFLDRMGMPWQRCEPGSPAGREVVDAATAAGLPVDLPLLDVHGRALLSRPSIAQVAQVMFGSPADLGEGFVADLVVVGGGPAGLAAAVYGASEGLSTVVVDSEAIGGQAGTSSMIRNYLGFPRGISGMRLTQRARMQALRFGARTFAGQPVSQLRPGTGGAPHELVLPEHTLRARAVVVASGVSYRRLGVESVEALVGRGVAYGAAMSYARECTGKDVYLVGGGNSAGQAAIHLSRYARSVTILIRRDSLAATMSSYLIREIEENPRVSVRPRTRVLEAGGAGRLEWLRLGVGEDDSVKVPAAALFLLLGATPCADWLPPEVLRDERGFVLTGRDVPREQWPEGRPPVSLGTTVPGVFAAGDVRAGSMKRVASAAGEGAAVVPEVHAHLEPRPAGGAA